MTKNQHGGARPKTRPDDERGGSREGAGKPGSVAPLKLIAMGGQPEAAVKLARITAYRRKTGSPRISQQSILAELIAAEHARLGLDTDVEIGMLKGLAED